MENHIHHVEHHKPHLTEKQLKRDPRNILRIVTSFMLDMLPVIFGILIAVGINSWREKKHEKETETVFLNGIKKNLDSTITGLEFDIKFFSQIMDARRFFLSSKQKSDTAISNNFSKFFYIIQPNFTNTAFLTLQNTGRLDVISDRSIIENLTSLYEGKIPTLRFLLNDYNQKYNSLFLPYLVNIDRSNEVYKLSDIKKPKLYSGELKSIISVFYLEGIVGRYKEVIDAHRNLSRQIEEVLNKQD